MMISDLNMEGLYENEVCTLLQSVKDKLQDATEESAILESGQADPLEVLETEFQTLGQALKQFEAEARTQAESTSRKALQAKVKQYKDDMKALRTKMRTIKEQVERKRLTAGRGGQEYEERLMNMNQRMANGTDTLERSKRTMMEIEETAVGVSDQLAQNRATILSTKRKIDETNSLTGQARQLLRNMEHNERVKKLVGYAGIGTAAFCIMILLYAMVIGF